MIAGTSSAPTFPGFCREFIARRMPVWLLCVVLLAGVVLCEASALLLGQTVSAGRVAAGSVSFMCAFLLLRITDDIDDEAHGRPLWERAGLDTERRLALLGLLALGVLAATAWYYGDVVIMVVGVACTPLVSFVVRPHLTRHDHESLRVRGGVATILLGVGYEGAPAVIIAAVPIGQADVGVSPARLASVLLLSGLFWSGYENFKFGRVLVRPGWHPYGLGTRAVSAGLAVLAGVGAAAVAALWISGWFPVGVAVLLGGAFAGVASVYLLFGVSVSRRRRPTSILVAARFLPLGVVIAGTAVAVFIRSRQ
jgi:hypothetical protein